MRRRLDSPRIHTAARCELAGLPVDALACILSNVRPHALAAIEQSCSSLNHAIASLDAWRPACRELWPSMPVDEPVSSRWYGLRVRMLRGAVICCSGLVPNDRLTISSAVEQLGGKILDTFGWRPRVRVTHLVTTNAWSEKALAAWHRTRIVQPTWLWESVRHGQLQPVERHAVPPMLGILLTSTGLSESERGNVEATVVRLGGRYEPTFSVHTTHLLAGRRLATELRQLLCADDGSSEVQGAQRLGGAAIPAKVHAAIRLGIPVIEVGWLALMHVCNAPGERRPPTAGPHWLEQFGPVSPHPFILWAAPPTDRQHARAHQNQESYLVARHGQQGLLEMRYQVGKYSTR